MTGLTRLLCCSLILTTGTLGQSSWTAHGQSEAKPKGTASISGRVTIDDKPAPGIPVAVFSGDTPNRSSVARATTDSEGRYRLFGLLAAQYQIIALAPSMTQADPNPGSTSFSYYGAGKSIVLSAAESVDDVDLKLVRGGVITGRVTDSDGKPVVEQPITIHAVDQNGAPIERSQPNWNYQMNQTDDRGVYRLYGLPAGRYKVTAGTGNDSINFNGHGYYPLTYYPDVTDASKATIVELGEGSEAKDIDIQVGHRAETYSATGRIVDADSGRPVSGTRFSYGPAPKKDQEFYGGFIGGPITNPQGEFRIDGLEPGRYGVAVSSFNSGNSYGDPVFFEVTDSDVTGLEVKAITGLSLSGSVVIDGADKAAAALPPTASIYATVASSANPQSRSSGSSTIAADGSFQISGLRPGKATLFIYVPANSNSLRNLSIARIERDGVEQPRVIDIAPGQSLSGLRVVTIFGTGIIRGVVKFENGTPPPNARTYVGLRREGSNDFSRSGATIDSRGHFSISNLPPGTYEVTLQLGFPAASGRPQAPQKQFVTVADDTETEVTFTVDLAPKESGP